MSDDPLVSIVIPTYDRVGWVETAIESVLSQDHPRIELIVVDDGSHDETPQLLERIAARADPARFRHVRHDNVGQAASINRGLELASGDLLGYLSSDDHLLPGALSRLAAEARAHPGADVLYPGYRVSDAAGRHRDTIDPMQHTWVDALRWAICVPGPGALVHRRLYERIGGWDPTYRTCPDYEWWIRAGDAVFHHVPATLAVWCGHDGSITQSQLSMAAVYERLRLLDGLYARDDLPEAVRAVQDEAYANLLIQAGVMLPGARLDDPDRRFTVLDRFAVTISQQAQEDVPIHQRRVEGLVSALQRQAQLADAATRAAQDAAAAEHAISESLRAALADREAQLAAARQELQEARQAQAPDPPPRRGWARGRR